MTEAQTQALAGLPRYYTARDVVEIVFAGDHDAFVDAWAGRALPPGVRQTLEELVPADRQQVWLLQRLLAVALADRDRAALPQAPGEPPSP